jgi:hypothetical protein
VRHPHQEQRTSFQVRRLLQRACRRPDPPAPLEERRGDEGGHDHHDDDRGVGGRPDHFLSLEDEGRPDAGEDQADLPAGDHPDPDGPTVDRTVEDPEGAELLPGDGGDREEEGEPERLRRSERREVDLRPHLDEEDRGEQFHDGAKGILEIVDVPIPEFLEMDRFEDEPRRERTHDRRQARHPGQVGQQEAECKGNAEQNPRPPQSRRARKQAGCDPRAEEEGTREEPHRLQRDLHLRPDPEGSSALPRRDDGTGDGGQDDQSENVVHDGGPEDDPRLLASGFPDVLKDARRDADARGAQGGPEEGMGLPGIPGNEPGPDQPSEGEGRGDAQHRHEERGEPHAQDVPDRRLQPHLEQEHHYADPGEEVDAGIGREPLEPMDSRKVNVAEENPRQELPEDRRLPEHDGKMSHQLRGHEDHDEVQEERDGRVLSPRERDRGEQEDGGEGQNSGERHSS